MLKLQVKHVCLRITLVGQFDNFNWDVNGVSYMVSNRVRTLHVQLPNASVTTGFYINLCPHVALLTRDSMVSHESRLFCCYESELLALGNSSGNFWGRDSAPSLPPSRFKRV